MDEEWRGLALQMCYHVDPASWERTDWGRIAWAFGVTLLTAWHSTPNRAAMLSAVLAVAFAGLLGSVVAPYTHYRLLIQVSPYRAMWVLELLAVPLSIHWAVVCWRQGSGLMRSLSLAVLLFLPADPYYVPLALVLVGVGLFLPLAIGYRGLRAENREPDWLWTCTVRAFAGTIALGLAYDVMVPIYYLTVASFTDQRPDLHPTSVMISVVRLWYRLPLLPAAVWVGRRMLPQARTVVACVLCWRSGFSTRGHYSLFPGLTPMPNDSCRHPIRLRL